MMLVQTTRTDAQPARIDLLAQAQALAEGVAASPAAPERPQAQEHVVRRDLLFLALQNIGRVLPTQVATLGVIVVLALSQSLWLPAFAVGLLGTAVSAWRWQLMYAFDSAAEIPGPAVAGYERQVQWHSAAAGAVWVIATIWIYPHLPLLGQQVFVILAAGSLAVAAFFLSLIPRSFEALVIPMVAALAGVHVFDDELRSLPLAGVVVVFAWSMFRGTAASRATTAQAVRDRHAADAMVDSLRQARDAAQAANIAKSQFLATMSHEIRTPMNGVLGALELLRASELEGHQRELVRSAATSSQALMEILNDVLDNAKIEAGKLAITPAPMSTHALLGAVAGLFRSNADRKRLELRVDIDPAAADRVWADAARLKQVLMNLVSNALHFTERGRVSLRLRPAPSADAGWAGLCFEVVDTGIGMPPQDLPGLFEPFHQIQTGDTEHRGTGLGLAISQRIVAAMGGKIEVQSEPGRGSTFSFVLQVRRDLEERGPVPPRPPAAGGLRRFRGSVLVVEDDPINRLVAADMLRHMGLTVAEAGDGLEALQQTARQRFSLVLMDCSLPVLDGYTATVELRQRELRQGLPRLPVIAITAHAFDRDAAAGREAGMDGFLSKPYTISELAEVLAQWLPEADQPAAAVAATMAH